MTYPEPKVHNNIRMQKARKYAPITDNLNRLLQKSLSQFSNNVEWTDINNWLQKVQQIIKENPSPYISQKIVLSKRLQQGLNPALPVKVHECVIRIHELIFSNMRTAVEGNVNEYIRLFAEDLGVYSVGLFPFFGKTSTMSLRLFCLGLFKDYYMDLRKELIPLLPGMLISLLPVYGYINDDDLKAKIFQTLDSLIKATGRKYFIGAVWMSILKHPSCRSPGLHILKQFVPPMKLLVDQESLQSSHGFSDIEDELIAQTRLSSARKIRRSASVEKSKRKTGRASNSLDRGIGIQKQEIDQFSDNDHSPLVRRQGNQNVFDDQATEQFPSNTVASLLGVPQGSNLIYKPVSPRVKPNHSNSNQPSMQTTLARLDQVSSEIIESQDFQPKEETNLHGPQPAIMNSNLKPPPPPPPFNYNSGIKPPANFQMPSMPSGFQIPALPTFAMPSNFTPMKMPVFPMTPPPKKIQQSPTGNLPKQLEGDMTNEAQERKNQSPTSVDLPDSDYTPTATSLEHKLEVQEQTPVREIQLSPGNQALVTPPIKMEGQNFPKPPEGFKLPPNFVPPPAGFKFPPPGQTKNQPKPFPPFQAGTPQKPAFKTGEKVDFSKMPHPPPGFKFDPSLAPPPGFKMPSVAPPAMRHGPVVHPPQPNNHPKTNPVKPQHAQNQSSNKLVPAKPQGNKAPVSQKKPESKVQNTLDMIKKESTALSAPRKPIPALDKVPYVPTPQLDQLGKYNDENLDDNNYPNRSSLVLNAIISCLSDENSLVRRHMLDFMCSHLRVKNKVFTAEDKKVVVEAVLFLFVKKELTITKRVNNWLFGKPDEEQNKYFLTEKNELVVPYIIDGLGNMLSRQPKTAALCTQPLKVLQNFYMQHQHLVSKTLPPIVLPTIRYIFNFGFGKEYSTEVMKSGQRFFQNIPSFYDVILQSLGDELYNGIKNDDDLRCFQVSKYLDFCYLRLMKHEFGPQELEYITTLLHNLSRTLDVLSVVDNDLSKYSFLKSLMLLIVNLIDRKERIDQQTEARKLNEKQSNLEESQVKQLSKERVQYDNELRTQQKARQTLFQQIAESFQKFYIRLGQIIRMASNLQPYEQPFKLGSLAITKVQRNLPKEEVKVLPAWFDAIEVGIKLTNPVISLSAIEAMIYCLTSESVHPAYNSFKRLIIAQKNKKVGSDYQKQALEKLWSLLDFPHMHRKVIDLIINFSKYFPYQFTEVVSRSFQTHNVPDKEASIQRFSHFWRLTGNKYKDLLQHNHQLAQLNKVGLFVMLDFLEDNNPLVRHAAKNWLLQSMTLFSRVLQPLFSQLMKVGDNNYITPQGQNIITRKYDTKKMFGIFRRIKSILTNGASSFLSYIYQTPITQNLEEQKNTFTDIRFPVITKQPLEKVELPVVAETKQPVLPRGVRDQQQKVDDSTIHAKLAYMDLLIIISLKYIKGQAIESMGIDFHVGNSSVNAASIEFLEAFLGYIDDPKLCERFINFILNDLFRVLEQGVGNREYIIQVQLLNLFKTIFFNSSFRLKGSIDSIRKMFSYVYTNPIFTNSLLKGLNTPFSYVRTQFISFISISIPLIADFLQPQQCTNIVKSILYTYYQIIKGVNMRMVKDQQSEVEKIEEPPANLKRIIELREKNIKQSRTVKLTDNLTEVAKTNQILAILHGVSVILNYFFELDKLDYKKILFQFTDPYTVFDTFKSIISLGFASSEKQQKLISKPIFLHNLQTCESILRDVGPVFETILRSWPLSQEYVKIAASQFSEIGVKSFGFQRFSKYNSVLKSLIQYVSTQKESIWGKIISIMKPMFFKFPKEIVSIYIELWIRECPSMDSQGKFQLSSDKCQFLMKIIQTLIVNDFPLNILVSAYVESPIMERVRNYHQSRQKDLRKGNVLEYEMAVLESKLIFFIHVIFHYLHLTNEVLQRDNLLTHWRLILKAIKPFLPSKNPNTCLWILEFINLCAKKYSPKQILSFQKFKTELHLTINDKLKFVAGVGSKSMSFFYDQPAVDLRSEQTNSKETMAYRILLPYTPSIYELLQQFKDPNRFKVADQISLELFTPIRPGNNQAIERRNRFFAFKTLKRIGLELIQNTYMPEKNHWIVTRTKQWVDEILPVIEDKSPENMVFAEAASEVLHDLLDKARSMFLRVLKADLINIFNKDDFFICNVATLKYWSSIIDWVVNFDKNNETFSYYLEKVALSTSYFSSGDGQTKKRVKSFERVCFILYSGCKDRYAGKIKGLLQKISQILKKSESAHPSLLILILFAIRILILRLSEITLNQLFIDIWPMIMTLLIQLFSKKLVKVQLSNQISKHPNLLLAALKLIEMASVVNLAQFSHHQWIFLYDYFGVKMCVQEGNFQMNQFFNANPDYREIFVQDRITTNSPFLFKPSLTNYFPPYTVDYVPRPYPNQLSIIPIRRKLIIKQAKVVEESELRIRAIVLCQYLINLNELRVEVVQEDIEMLLVNDFISLDNFIHKM